MEAIVAPVNQREWELVPFTQHPGHDSIWSLARAQDGNIYIGLSQEYTGGGVAQLYRYNVAKRKMEHCLDMEKVTGERFDSGHATQCKIHFALCPASDGRIYGATHCTAPPYGHPAWNVVGMWGDPQMNFPGSHLFRFDPKTGEADDYGVIWPNQGIPFLLLNEETQRLCGITYPKAHFFSMNLHGRDIRDYGRVSSWYPIGMCFDRQYNVWFSDTSAQLIKYDLAKDELVFTGQYPYAHPWNKSRRFSWVSNMNLADDGRIYCTPYCNDHLSRFDPEAKKPAYEDLGQGLPGTNCRLLRCLIPDGKGHVYYVACPDMETPTATRNRVFMKYHIASGRKEVIGTHVVDGNQINGWIGVTDREGNIYIKAGESRPMNLAIYRPRKSAKSKL